MKVAICVPVYGGNVKAAFALSLARLVSFAATHAAPNKDRIELEVFFTGALLPRARNDLAERGLAWGADWLLWMDYDHTFPPETLHQFLSHERQIVGANYRCRVEPIFSALGLDGEPLTTTAEKAEARLVEPVRSLGMGLCLVSADAMRSAGPKPFLFSPDGETSEDVAFMDLAREAGFQPYVDHYVSWYSGHITEVLLTPGQAHP